MRKRNYTFKPLNNIHMLYLIFTLLIFTPFDITLLFHYSPSLLITVVLMNMLPLAIFAIVRMFFNTKYVVDDDYVIKYHGKKIVLKIKISDVNGIYIKKAKWFSFFTFIYEAICSPFTQPHGTSFSLVFEKCDVIYPLKQEIPRKSLISNNQKDLLEYCEILSFRRCKKLCKKLQIVPILV